MADQGISKRGDKWVIVVNLGIDPVTGKRRRQVVTMPPGTTKRDAEKERTRLLRKRDLGELGAEPTKLTVTEYLAYWQKHYVEPNCRPKTAAQYEYIAGHYLVPLLGRYRLVKLATAHVRESFSALLTTGIGKGKPLSAKSLELVGAVLHRALDHAVKWQMVGRNVADALDLPKPKRRELKVWTAEEARRFLDVAPTVPFGAAMALALLTGMRIGEVAGLRWQDVDLERGALRVTQTIGRVKRKGLVVGEPKTTAGRRRIALPPLAVELLRSHKAKQNGQRLQAGPAWQDNGLVFTNPLGEPINPPRLREDFQRTAKAAGLPRLTFHGLRHTHASLLLANNEHPKAVAERLGHSNTSITMNVYSHLLPGLQESVAARLDTMLRAPTPVVDTGQTVQ